MISSKNSKLCKQKHYTKKDAKNLQLYFYKKIANSHQLIIKIKYLSQFK